MATISVSKTGTHRPIFTGTAADSVVESADSTVEWADSTTNSAIVGRLVQSADGKLAQWVESADGNRPILVGRFSSDNSVGG